MLCKTPDDLEIKGHWGQKEGEGLSCSGDTQSAAASQDRTVPHLSALGDQQEACS